MPRASALGLLLFSVTLALYGQTARFEFVALDDLAYVAENPGVRAGLSARADLALEHYRRALELEPGLARAHNNLDALLFTRGRIDAAIPHFREVLRLRPDHAGARRNLELALAEQSR